MAQVWARPAGFRNPHALVSELSLTPASMVGNSVLLVGDPLSGLQPMPISISYYVDSNAETVDDAYQRALEAGATSLEAPQDQFYGYRSATVRDPGGNRWSISAVVEQLTSEESHRRMPDTTHVT